jgi:hypothetical protein
MVSHCSLFRIGFGDDDEGQKGALGDDRSTVGTDADGAVSEPATELLLRARWILLEAVVELDDLGLDLLDAREVKRLLRIGL